MEKTNLQKIIDEGFVKKGQGSFLEIYLSDKERVFYNPRTDKIIARYKRLN